MRQTDFQTDEYHPSPGEKLIVRPPRQSTLWRRVGISAAVVFVILNIVAWTAIVQHLRPSHPNINVVGSGVSATATVKASQPTPTPKPLQPTPTSLPNGTLYTFTCQGNFIHPLAWSPDSKYIASGDSSETAGGHVYVWVAK